MIKKQGHERVVHALPLCEGLGGVTVGARAPGCL